MTTLGRLVSRPWSDPRADIPGDLQNFVRKVRRESDLMLRLAGLGKNTWGYIGFPTTQRSGVLPTN